MAVRTLVDQHVRVAYAQIFVESGNDAEDTSLPASFAGQRNGLCGAVAAGQLFLITGLHTGHVGFTVELHTHAPTVDESWEDIVEAPFVPATDSVALVEWGGERVCSLPLIAGETYRVRYSGNGLDIGDRTDTRLSDEPAADRYLLQFWPDRIAGDAIVKQTSGIAAYWHDYAQHHAAAELDRIAAAKIQETADREAQERKWNDERRAAEVVAWGGKAPSERLRSIAGHAQQLAAQNRALVDSLAAAPAERQRAIAVWAARRAYEMAGLATVDWIASGLTAIDADRQVPPPFDDIRSGFERLFADPQVPQTTIDIPLIAVTNASQQAFAFPALFHTLDDDPLTAAIEAVYTAGLAAGHSYRAFFDEADTRLAG